MCNRYGERIAYQLFVDGVSAAKLRLERPAPEAAPNLEPHDQIRPTNLARILRPIDERAPQGLELVERRWGLIPFFHKGPVKAFKFLGTNARSEGVATTATFREPFRRRRCLVPASYFFEWTGPKGGKTMWRFTRRDAEWFCFPGLWDRAQTADGEIESFTLLTCAAGPDMAPYHDRQPVLLDPQDWGRWLDLTADVAPLLQPSPAGALTIERVDPSAAAAKIL